METNLFAYEQVLLALGAILFLGLLATFAYFIKNNRSVKNLFWYFAIPIVMIGFPSFESFTYENGKVELKRWAAEIEKDPTNEENIKKYEEALQKLPSDRVSRDNEISKSIAQTYLILGNIDTSEATINKAISVKNDEEAKAIKNKIQKTRKKEETFKKDIEKLKEVLSDGASAAKNIAAIAKVIKKITVPDYTDQNSQLTLAESLDALGEKEKSLEAIDKVLKVNPNSNEAKSLKEKILQNKTVPKIIDRKTLDIKKFDQILIKRKPLVFNKKSDSIK